MTETQHKWAQLESTRELQGLTKAH